MSSTLDEIAGPHIETAGSWPGGLDFTFPRRDLGRVRYVLWLAIVLVAAIGYWLVAEPILRIVRNGAGFGSVAWLAVWGFLAFQLCRYPLWHLLVLLFGHREIGLREDWLSVGDRLGWFRRSKRWPLARVRQMQLVDLLPKSRGLVEFRAALSAAGRDVPPPSAPAGSLVSDLVRHLNALTAVLDNETRILLALAYPKPLLEEFSQELSKQIAVARGESGLDTAELEPKQKPAAPHVDGGPVAAAAMSVAAAPAIGISELLAEAKESLRKIRDPDVFEQPIGSTVEVDQFDGGLTFRIPPAGVWKGSAGMFPFGVLFAVVTLGFTLLFAGAQVAQGQGQGSVWGAIGVMSLFWLASGGMLFGGWVLGTRQTAIAVVGESVMVMQTGLRRAKRREWPRSDVKTARVGPSGTEINDKPVLELQLLGADDKKLFGMLMGRDVQELHWMATLLRQALKPKTPPAAEPTQTAEAAPPTLEIDYSGMTIEERMQVARLTDEFASAVQRDDRAAMLNILERVQLPVAGAAAYVDAVLADPRQHGF